VIASIALRVLRRLIDRMNAGDPRPLVRMFAKDAVLTFPGESSWSGQHRGRAEIERFMRRFHHAGLRLHPVDLAVHGWPWNMTALMWWTDDLITAEGERIYENRGAFYIKLRWGKVVFQEDVLDTQKVAALDEWLADRNL
jgi:ketosteroid isomerase-like protein